MSRFDQEWAVVPTGARWTAVLAGLAFTALMAGIFLLPALAERDPKALVVLSPFFLLTLLGAVPLVIYVLLLGYVWGDARRRGMSHVMWTLLALFIPSAVGLILYFILREPLPVPCPSCGTPARKGHAYCASCGAAVRAACPHCRQPVEPGWRNCASCGQPLRPAAAAPPG
jgi:Double zinc ribbon